MAYAVVGGLALLLAEPPAYASPLYPSAGIALAATLAYGRRAALPGVLLGALTVNAGLGLLRGQSGLSLVLLPLLIGTGAALQAGVGAMLIRRFVGLPVVLNAPRDILLAGGLGALVACAVSPSVAVPSLLVGGAIGGDAALSTWLTWWVGDTLGVLVAAPLALTLIGRPREDWRPRRLTLGLPLLVALALLAAALVQLGRLDRQRLMATFERGADRLASEAQARLSAPVYALQTLHSAARARGELDERHAARGLALVARTADPAAGHGAQRARAAGRPAGFRGRGARAGPRWLPGVRPRRRCRPRRRRRGGGLAARRADGRQCRRAGCQRPVDPGGPRGHPGHPPQRSAGGHDGFPAHAVGGRRTRRRRLPGAVPRRTGQRSRTHRGVPRRRLRHPAHRGRAGRAGPRGPALPALVPRRSHARAPRRRLAGSAGCDAATADPAARRHRSTPCASSSSAAAATNCTSAPPKPASPASSAKPSGCWRWPDWPRRPCSARCC